MGRIITNPRISKTMKHSIIKMEVTHNISDRDLRERLETSLDNIFSEKED